MQSYGFEDLITFIDEMDVLFQTAELAFLHKSRAANVIFRDLNLTLNKSSLT